MTKITGEIVIGAPADVVFDFAAGQRNEPAYNPHMVRSAKVTPGPVGKGTQFRSAVRSRGRLAEMAIKYTGFQRPSRLALARGCGGHGTPGSPGRCGCWHRSSPGQADGRNERRGQGSSGTWSPPSTRRAPRRGAARPRTRRGCGRRPRRRLVPACPRSGATRNSAGTGHSQWWCVSERSPGVFLSAG